MTAQGRMTRAERAALDVARQLVADPEHPLTSREVGVLAAWVAEVDAMG